jgi:TorA maturation chaperone TorD
MTQVLRFAETLPPEEVARANFYGLLARLFYAPPDAALLGAIAAADERVGENQAGSDDGVGAGWQALASAAAVADVESVREEYDTVLVGTGKAPVTLYTCAYSIKYSNEAPLVDLRAELAALGLARRESVSEPEDHIAALCDVMRHLIIEQQRDLAEQQRFFSRWIEPTGPRLCDAISAHPALDFYKHVGRFANAFFRLEQSAFEML